MKETRIKEVKARDVLIGSGMPKICVPICGRNEEEVFCQAEAAVIKQPDLLEWRADWLEGTLDEERLVTVLVRLRSILKNIPLLYTFRTIQEGGEKAITLQQYYMLLCVCAQSGLADLVDIEAFFCKDKTREYCALLQAAGVKVVASYHNFHHTPDKNSILQILLEMQAYEPDIVKTAFMPGGFADTVSLMEAVEVMNRLYAEMPIIAVSMAEKGAVSRFTGELYGSAVTFAAAEVSSASGQADIEDTRKMLLLMHRGLCKDGPQAASAAEGDHNETRIQK